MERGEGPGLLSGDLQTGFAQAEFFLVTQLGHRRLFIKLVLGPSDGGGSRSAKNAPVGLDISASPIDPRPPLYVGRVSDARRARR
jgi:hypothetical protein